MKFRRLGTMLDCSRNAVMTVDSVKSWIDITADIGYNTLLLYTEDTYEIEGEPLFGHLRGKYSLIELMEIEKYANSKNMEFIPCIQTLAHLNAIFRWEKYRSICDCDDILLAQNDSTYDLIEKMFKSLRSVLKTNIINIGMDEAHMLGRGRFQDINGVKDKTEILFAHLYRVSEIAKKYDFKLIMWGDMFFRLLGLGDYYNENTDASSISSKIPDNVDIIYWDYYSTEKNRYDLQLQKHKTLKDNIWFAGGLWTWAGFAPHNVYSIKATKAAFSACIEHKVQDAFLTMWGDNGGECSKYAMLPSLFAAAQYAIGNTDEESIKVLFEEKYGISFEDFMLLDLPFTPNGNQSNIVNAEKYMLYNDCFLGKFDCFVESNVALQYAQNAEKLKPLIANERFGYLFDTLYKLCMVLSIKYDLGVKTREVYLSKDKVAIKRIVESYSDLLNALDEFYYSYKNQWNIENKPHGFDVQDIRIGGLYFRTRHCKEILEDFISGNIEKIPELEEMVLNPFLGSYLEENKTFWFNNWNSNVTTNVL